jgi:hypothetical protein
MVTSDPSELRAFLPQRQDALLHTVSQLHERLSPKEREWRELTDLMADIGITPWKEVPRHVVPAPGKEATLNEFLLKRHWNLSKEIEAIRGALTPKEKELQNVQKAMQKLGIAGEMVRLDALPASEPTAEAEAPTIKKLIVDALRDHFRDGATGTELSQYFLTVHGREIDRTSISPQLTRLREDDVVEQLSGESEGKWALKVHSHPIEKVLADEYAEATSREEPQKIHRRKIGP